MRLILEFLKPHWRLCAVTMALSLLDAGGALLIPTLVGDLINGATGGAIGFDGLLRTGVWMVVVATVSGIAAIAGGWVCAVLTARVGRDLREAVYRKSLTLSVSDFRAFGVSSFTTRTTSDVSNIRFALLNFFQLVVPVPVVFAFALALAFGKDWVLGALLAAVLAVICALSVPIVRQAAGIFRLLQKQLDRIATVLLENITGVRVVRAFDKSAHEEARMKATFEDYRATGVQTVRLFAFMDGYLFSAINLFILAVLAVSGFRIEAGRFAPGDITAVIEYAWLALVYLQLALTVALTLPRAFECLDRIRAVFDHPPQIRDAPDCGPIPRQPEVLALHGVSFRYPDAEEPTLVGLDFVCRRGETTAIIGGTGNGKSTIASLFLRFNEATEGTVRFNGVDVREIPLASLRADIAYVQQRAWLFAGTVAENLRYGAPGAAPCVLWHALEVAQAADFVRALPLGLSAYVAPDGANFSGGQRQRLSIARAVASKPQAYVFDDSFSALDFKTDAALRRALAAETAQAAVIVVAQRVSTIRNADQIVVLDEGRQVGLGTHEALMASCPVYQEIVRSQTKED